MATGAGDAERLAGNLKEALVSAATVLREDVLTELAPLLEVLAYNAYLGNLNGLPRAEERLSHYVNPQPGDYVAEISCIASPRRKRGTGFGVLVKVTEEGIYTANGDPYPADDFSGEPEPTDTFWYILLLDGTLFRWHDCRFIRAPEYVVEWIAGPLPWGDVRYVGEVLADVERNRARRLAYALKVAEEQRPDFGLLPGRVAS